MRAVKCTRWKISLIFIAITTSVVLLCMHAFWTNDIVKIEEPLQNYEVRHKMKDTSSVSRCNKSSKNLIGYESDNRDKALIIYSEMPKCGSGTFVRILSDVCKYSKHYRTKYTWPTPSPVELQSVESKQKYVSSKILPLRPYIFMGHLSFLDFIELGYKQPLYIDIVRDPVERWISLYYYKRVSPFPYKKIEPYAKGKKPNNGQLHENLDFSDWLFGQEHQSNRRLFKNKAIYGL
ncbi:unnamed protein product [Owenia fusiformis]|uniref:Sulfotransferase n=1 Tax=Owenia fusiformis TaxID=6347 RepID=A0A8S4PXS4_OWEFU|nr:unnamed protein product [Owenia fusiformis]